MPPSEHLANSFFPVLLTDSAKSQRQSGARRKAGGYVLLSGHGLLAVVKGTEGHLSRPTHCGPKKSAGLYMDVKAGSPSCHHSRKGGCGSHPQGKTQSFLTVTRLHKAGSPTEGTSKFSIL